MVAMDIEDVVPTGEPAYERGPVPDHHGLVIIGAGLAGIGLAVRLRRLQMDDFVILEREDDLGGTWYVNSYPGCQCDVPSMLYSYSFAPNPNWSRAFAPQPEIEEYVRSVADRHDVKRSVRFGHDVRSLQWDGDQRRWTVETSQGTITADVVVLGSGPLNEPSLPAIEGLERFEGTIFHSAQWRHDHDLTGKRVAAIGTGASAIQFVPQIQPDVGHLTVFQRTAPWIMPRPDRAFSGWERTLYRRVPITQQLVRTSIYWARELMVLGLAKYPCLAKVGERLARRHLAAQVPDADLRAKLTPGYVLGCKRVLLSNDYLPALMKPNVDVVTDGIREVLPHAIVTVAGTEHPVDTIILGTGFEAAEPPMARKIHGADGRTMREHWVDDAPAYLGSTVSGFPNLFLLIGPNTGLGHSSMIFMMESQFNYVIDALRTMSSRDLATVDVRPEIVGRYDDEIQRKLSRSVWNSGCASWYLDSRGRNTTMWPDFTWQYRRRTRRFDLASYATTPR